MNNVNQIVTDEHLSGINAYVAEKSVYRGSFVSDADKPHIGMRVDGTVHGSIKMPVGGVVHIGPSGKVLGTDGVAIEADIIFVESNVNGHVVGRKGVELAGSAVVRGDIKYFQGLAMHNLAKVRGSISYAGDE